MAFAFRLERVLELRRDELKEAQKVLAEALRTVENAKQKLIEAQQTLKKSQDDMIKDEYKLAEAHLRNIRHWDDMVKKREIKLKDAEDQLVRARESLIQAQVKVEALENLKERQLAEYNEMMDKLEQKTYDERASIKHARKGMGESHGVDHLDFSHDEHSEHH